MATVAMRAVRDRRRMDIGVLSCVHMRLITRATARSAAPPIPWVIGKLARSEPWRAGDRARSADGGIAPMRTSDHARITVLPGSRPIRRRTRGRAAIRAPTWEVTRETAVDRRSGRMPRPGPAPPSPARRRPSARVRPRPRPRPDLRRSCLAAGQLGPGVQDVTDEQVVDQNRPNRKRHRRRQPRRRADDVACNSCRRTIWLPSDRSGFTVHWALILEFSGSLISSETRLYDFTGLLMQLGVLMAKGR